MYFMHVFTTMQCAAMARVVFVKSVKKVASTEEFLIASSHVNAEAHKKYSNSGDDDDEFQKSWRIFSK